MISIIIERSQDCMQVVGVYYGKTSTQVRDIANAMADKLDDYDVREFENEQELNSRLENQVCILSITNKQCS